MKRFLAVLSMVVSLGGLSFGAVNNSYMPLGDYKPTNTPTSGVISTSSTTYQTSAAVDYGVLRIFQNTGGQKVEYFYNSANATMSNKMYLAIGERYVEDKYFGDIYFISPAGVTSSSCTYVTITNK